MPNTGAFAFAKTYALNDTQNLTFDGIHVWVCNSYQDLYVYDTSGVLITTIFTSGPPYNFAGDVEGMCYDGRRMWIAGNGSLVASIDLSTYMPIKIIDGSSSPYYNLTGPSTIIFDGKQIWVCDASSTMTSIYVGK